MRIISTKTLRKYWEEYAKAKQSIISWYKETESAQWSNPNELKEQFGNASVINNKRVVFNIHGNDFRLVTDIEYRLKIVFIVWFGTHKQYDKINVKEIKYDNKAR